MTHSIPRPEYELFDLKVDPKEQYNVAEKPNYQVPTYLLTCVPTLYFKYIITAS